MEHWVCM